MNYSEIINYVISRRYFLYYSILIFMSVVLVLFSFYGSIFSLLIFWLSIMSISCILINMYRCRSFLKFCNNYLKAHNAQFIRIIIEQEASKMPVPYKSYDATIQPFPKLANAVSLETDDLLLLFFSIRYIGIFQLVLKPFIFLKTDKDLYFKDKNTNIIQYFEIVEAERGRAFIFPNKHGIRKIIVSEQITSKP